MKKKLSGLICLICVVFLVLGLVACDNRHKHTACEDCGLCTDTSCTGSASDKCPGHNTSGDETDGEETGGDKLITKDGLTYRLDTENGVAIITSADSTFNGYIPSNITHSLTEEKEYSVTSIAGKIGNSTITELTIPDSMKSIATDAFSDCSSLTSATIPSLAINYIPKNNLETIVITSGSSIDESAFKGCSKLTNITISDSVTSIGEFAFAETPWYNNQPVGVVYAGKVAYDYIDTMPATTKIIIKEGTLGIASNAFIGCSSLTSITIPDSVTSIGNSAFYGCSSLTSIKIPNGVTSIGISAFAGCSSLTSITIPNGVTSIGKSAFYNCRLLTSITMPNSVTSIGISAFESCRSLENITLPNSVTSIGSYAFLDCTSLTSITIPKSVTSIGDMVFSECNELASVIVEKGNTRYHSTNNCIIETETKTLILGCKSSIIPADGSVTSIGEYAFRDCGSLTSITIPNGVTYIGESAFRGCNSLTSITISDSVTSIGENAFYGCSFTSITIPDSVTSIGENAFMGCDSIKSATMPSLAIKHIQKTYLKTIVITSGNSIAASAFYNCRSLTSITISDNVTSIGESAFYGCTKLTDIQFSGTTEQWIDMPKGEDWNSNTGNYRITCSNGVIDK